MPAAAAVSSHLRTHLHSPRAYSPSPLPVPAAGDAGYCDACRKAIDAPYFRCSECFDLDFCAACHATPEASLHRVPTAAKREKHLLTHRMAPAAPGDGIDHARLAAIAATGIEVVANVTYAGGHEMPKGQDPVYKQLAKLFAGTL